MVHALSRFWSGWTERLDALATASVARAVREGLLWVVPTLLLTAFMRVAAEMGAYLGFHNEAVGMFTALHRALEETIPLLIAASVGYALAILQHLPRLPFSFLCLTKLVIASVLLRNYPHMLSIVQVFMALIIPIASAPVLAWLSSCRWMPALRAGIVSDGVREVLNILLPALLTTLALIALVTALREPLAELLNYQFALPYGEYPYLSGLLVSGLNSLSWFFGIHGYYALMPLFESLNQAVALNAQAALSGQQPEFILNASQVAAFVFIGGSGATFALAISLILFCRNGTLRLLGIAGLPLALLNVNEVLLFGLPIILNPRLFLPFMIAPMVNVVLSLWATSAGFISPAIVSLPLTSPMFFNAYWPSGGDFNGVLLQLGLVVVGLFIYSPFVRSLDSRVRGAETIPVRSLNTTFRRLHEEAALYSYDVVAQANSLRKMQAEENQHIRTISEYTFFLVYQPQVSLREKHCVGCEALLRARDPAGRVHAPTTFLGWLERVGLVKDLDLWVAAEALRQRTFWKSQGFNMPISINVTSHTLGDPEYRQRLTDILVRANGDFIAEITEGALAEDIDEVREAIHALHSIGVEIAIDDFGTGYSSLSYLHHFEIDKIKIDRSFVVSSATEHGVRVLDGLLGFGERLGFSIVVEGVETQEQLDVLHAQGDLLIQGWVYSPALLPRDFVRFAQTCGR